MGKQNQITACITLIHLTRGIGERRGKEALWIQGRSCSFGDEDAGSTADLDYCWSARKNERSLFMQTDFDWAVAESEGVSWRGSQVIGLTSVWEVDDKS
jgi:hypothetical protein